jgi:hypothetical protein
MGIISAAHPDSDLLKPDDTVELLSTRASVDDLFVECLVEAFQVRNFKIAHGLDRHTERCISVTVLS